MAFWFVGVDYISHLSTVSSQIDSCDGEVTDDGLFWMFVNLLPNAKIKSRMWYVQKSSFRLPVFRIFQYKSPMANSRQTNLTTIFGHIDLTKLIFSRKVKLNLVNFNEINSVLLADKHLSVTCIHTRDLIMATDCYAENLYMKGSIKHKYVVLFWGYSYSLKYLPFAKACVCKILSDVQMVSTRLQNIKPKSHHISLSVHTKTF